MNFFANNKHLIYSFAFSILLHFIILAYRNIYQISLVFPTESPVNTNSWSKLNYYLNSSNKYNQTTVVNKTVQTNSNLKNKILVTKKANNKFQISQKSSKSVINLPLKSKTRNTKVTRDVINTSKQLSSNILSSNDKDEQLNEINPNEKTNSLLEPEDINYNRLVQLQIAINLGKILKKEIDFTRLNSKHSFILNVINYDGKISYSLVNQEGQNRQLIAIVVTTYIENELKQQRFTKNFNLSIPLEIIVN